jgi:coenzyme F420-reducing hydrogenase beta subunit
MKVLFTKQGCQKCEYVKSKLTDLSFIKDVGTPEGLALLAYLSLVTVATKNMPIYAEYTEIEGSLWPTITKVSTSVIETKNLCEADCKL